MRRHKTEESLIIVYIVVGWALLSLIGACRAETIPVENGNTLCGWFYEPRDYGPHRALDFPANAYTPIKCVRSGRVINADYDTEIGNYVDIFDGTGTWRYAHLQNYMVRLDDIISEGAVFASVGNTGTRSRGAHLHLQYRVNGRSTFFTDRFGVKFKLVSSKRQK